MPNPPEQRKPVSSGEAAATEAPSEPQRRRWPKAPAAYTLFEAGKSDEEIGAALNISPRTAQMYVSAIHREREIANGMHPSRRAQRVAITSEGHMPRARQQEAYKLHTEDGLSIAEVAEAMGTSYGTAKANITKERAIRGDARTAQKQRERQPSAAPIRAPRSRSTRSPATRKGAESHQTQQRDQEPVLDESEQRATERQRGAHILATASMREAALTSTELTIVGLRDAGVPFHEIAEAFDMEPIDVRGTYMAALKKLVAEEPVAMEEGLQFDISEESNGEGDGFEFHNVEEVAQETSLEEIHRQRDDRDID